MNKRILSMFLLVLLIGSIGAVMAVNDGENVTYKGYGNGTYVFNDSENNTVLGYCLNQTKSSPSINSNMKVSNDTSSVDNQIKELIVTYYRGDSSVLQPTNVAIRTAIWNITNHQSLGSTGSLADQMITNTTNNPLGVIGNNYTISDGIYNYFFNFYYGTSSSSSVQPMLLFTFLAELIPEIPEEPEPPIVNNTTNETNHTNETNTTEEPPITPVINNTTNETVINETNTTTVPTKNVTISNETENNLTIVDNEFVEENPTIANMKKTATDWTLPLLLVIIIAIIGAYVAVRK